MSFGKILVIAPHPDDEVLGCGGVLAEYGKNAFILYVTAHHPAVDDKDYAKEYLSVVNEIGANVFYGPVLHATNELHTLPITILIQRFEEQINLLKPDTVFVCFPSYNQDHRVVFDALITAIRPHDKNWFVKNVLVYEQPETLHTNRLSTLPFEPNVFVEIDIQKKLGLYHLYKSQIRGHRNIETIKGLAVLRGSFIGKPYAEAFACIRMTCE